jgi:hypothetical protein
MMMMANSAQNETFFSEIATTPQALEFISAQWWI